MGSTSCHQGWSISVLISPAVTCCSRLTHFSSRNIVRDKGPKGQPSSCRNEERLGPLICLCAPFWTAHHFSTDSTAIFQTLSYLILFFRAYLQPLLLPSLALRQSRQASSRRKVVNATSPHSLAQRSQKPKSVQPLATDRSPKTLARSLALRKYSKHDDSR